MGILEEIRDQQAGINAGLGALTDRIGRLEDEIFLTESYYMLSQLPALKSISLSTLKEHRYLQPLGGSGRKRIGGRWKWHRSAIAEWLLQDDDELEALYGPKSRREEVRKPA